MFPMLGSIVLFTITAPIPLGFKTKLAFVTVVEITLLAILTWLFAGPAEYNSVKLLFTLLNAVRFDRRCDHLSSCQCLLSAVSY